MPAAISLAGIRADIDSLDTFYLRLLAPVLTALCAGLLFILFLWHYSFDVALGTSGLLLVAGCSCRLRFTFWAASLRSPCDPRHHRSCAQPWWMACGGSRNCLAYDAAGRQKSCVRELNLRLLADQARLAGLVGYLRRRGGAVLRPCALAGAFDLDPTWCAPDP